MTHHNKYQDDHPYMKRLDEVLKDFFVCKVSDANGAEHGEDYEEMKQVILDALFHHHQQAKIREKCKKERDIILYLRLWQSLPIIKL